MYIRFIRLPILQKAGLVAIFTLQSLLALAQSGWVKPKGELYAHAGIGLFSSDQYYNLSGELLTTARFQQIGLSLYGEYGLTDRLDVILNWPAFKAHGFETTNTVAGLGDISLGLKYGLLRGPIPVSITLMPDFPTGNRNLFAQNKEIAFERINLPTGDGEFNLHTTLAASYGFGSAPFYLNLFGDYNYRTGFAGNDFRDQWTVGTELGWEPVNNLWVKANLRMQESIGQPTQLVDFIRSDGTTFTAYGLGAYYRFAERWGIDLTYQGFADFLAPRRNLYSAPFVGLGLVYERK
ncbi:MAG: hypothetical protein AAFQ87_16820 [Bacteroidota bacterium]